MAIGKIIGIVIGLIIGMYAITAIGGALDQSSIDCDFNGDGVIGA